MGAQTSSLGPDELEELCKVSPFTPQEITRLYKRFEYLDKEKLGRILLDELHAIPELAVNPLAHRIIATFDIDGRHEVNFRQFLSVLSVFAKDAKREQKLEFAFRVYDVNGDGLIDASDLSHIVRLMVGTSVNQEEIDNIVEQTIMDADTMNHDGAISFAEFKRAMFNADIESSMVISF